MSEYLITLQFTKHTLAVNNELSAVNKKLDDICVFMTYMMEMSGMMDDLNSSQ